MNLAWADLACEVRIVAAFTVAGLAAATVGVTGALCPLAAWRGCNPA